MSVGCDKKTSRAAAQTLAISAFFRGGLFVTLPEYPASSSLPIMLSTSSTCKPAPGLVILPLLIVAESAAPGERELLEVLDCMPEGPGEADLPSGEVPIAEGGGGELPSRDERNPRDSGLARIVEVVGTRGEGGARLEVVGMGDPAPRIGGLGVSRDPSAPLTVGFDEAELKLDTDPL